MINKSMFVFGFLLASAWTRDRNEEQVLEPENVVSASEENKIKLSDLLCENENERKQVNENIKDTEKDVSESG